MYDFNIKYQTGEACHVIIPDEAFQNAVGCLLDDDSVLAERTDKKDFVPKHEPDREDLFNANPERQRKLHILRYDNPEYVEKKLKEIERKNHDSNN